MRLAYVQHLFPAQGITTDTSHLIGSEHATGAGTYVALTRARERTYIYASHEPADPTSIQRDEVGRVAVPLGYDETQIASIDIPTHHEATPRHAEQPAPDRCTLAGLESSPDRDENTRSVGYEL